jgi:hypothetical protein
LSVIDYLVRYNPIEKEEGATQEAKVANFIYLKLEEKTQESSLKELDELLAILLHGS